VAVVAGLGIAAAALATAEDQTYTVNCRATASLCFYLSPGDSLVTSFDLCVFVVFPPGGPTINAWSRDEPTLTWTFTIKDDATSGATDSVEFDGLATVRVNFIVVAAPDPVTPATAADAPPIPAWVQSNRRASADATCIDGWNPSWESWAEPVTGGWVCTRSIPSLG
jgi:hypothetical protein